MHKFYQILLSFPLLFSLSLEMYPVTSNSSIFLLLSFFSSRRRCLYLMELSSLRKRPRMPGLVMHWQLLQTSTTTASLTCWWGPRWRMSTGGPSTSTTETVFTSSTITSRYLSFADIYIFTGAFENSIKLISDWFLLSAYSRVIDFPLLEVFWPQCECPIGLGWRWANRLGSGSTRQRCVAQVGTGRVGKGGYGIARTGWVFFLYIAAITER